VSNYAFSQLRKTLWKCESCSSSSSHLCSVCNTTLVNDNCNNCSLTPLGLNNINLNTTTYQNDNLHSHTHTQTVNSAQFNSAFDFNSVKGLKFGHLNINGLHNKFDELKSFLTTFKFQLFSLNELRLPLHAKLSFYNIPEYTFLPFYNESSTRGGSGFYLRGDCLYQNVEFTTQFPDFSEVNLIQLKIPFSKPILAINVYKSPVVDKSDFLKSLNNLLIEFSHFKGNLILLGDLNINLFEQSGHTCMLKSLASQFNLSQVINEPTRIDDKGSATLIDHAYVNFSVSNIMSGTFNLTNSDHKALYVIKHNEKAKIPYKIISVRKFADIDMDKVVAELSLIDWSKFSSCINSDEVLNYFESEVNKILDLNAPLIKRRVKGRNSAWMTKEIMGLISERDELKNECQKVKSNELWSNFKKMKHFVQNKINSAKRNYFLKKCDNALTSSQIWNVYNELSNFRLKKAQTIPFLISGGEKLVEASAIAESLSDQFALPGHDDTDEILKLADDIKIDDSEIDKFLTPADIISAYKTLKRSTCYGTEIPYIFLKTFIGPLSYPLKYMFDNFLIRRHLPKSFNSAVITPLYKGKGSRTSPENYRPISILPILGKLFEKVIYRKLYFFIEEENLLDPRQHGFRKNRSCTTALSIFADDICLRLDETNMKAGVVFVDLKKAFDSVRPLKLLLSLLSIKVPPVILLYLCMYFVNRTFKIKLSGSLSQLFQLRRGCPQGGILSPILFSLYYNGVGSSLLTAYYLLFADDLVFYIFNKDMTKLRNDLSLILDSLDNWCMDKDLIINYCKTEYMIISKTSNDSTENDIGLTCKGHQIKRVTEFKYLGVLIDERMTFKGHFDYVCRRVSSAVGCLMLIKRFLNIRTFKTLINSFVISIIDYALPIWGHLSKTQMGILQSKMNSLLGAYFYPQICNKFQRYCKIAHNYDNSTRQCASIDYFELYEKCNLLTVQERVKYFYAIFAYKAINSTNIPDISSHFSFGNSTRTQNLTIPRHRSCFFEKSSFYQSSLVWNSLPVQAKASDNSLPQFVKIINQWLIDGRLT
jgi:hypothetical protein